METGSDLPAFIYANEGEFPGLFDLPVNHAV